MGRISNLTIRLVARNFHFNPRRIGSFRPIADFGRPAVSLGDEGAGETQAADGHATMSVEGGYHGSFHPWHFGVILILLGALLLSPTIFALFFPC